MKLPWVHVPSIGGAIPAMPAPMHYGLRGKSLPHLWYSLDRTHCMCTLSYFYNTKCNVFPIFTTTTKNVWCSPFLQFPIYTTPPKPNFYNLPDYFMHRILDILKLNQGAFLKHNANDKSPRGLEHFRWQAYGSHYI